MASVIWRCKKMPVKPIKHRLDEKKAALYVRVSTRYQAADGDSLPMQKEELPKYVKYALGIENYEIFEDAGFSAKNTDRPAFQAMMARIRKGEFTHLVVWKLDRISRNLLDFASMYAELKKLGVTFISKNEQFDTSSAIGEAMLKIILVFAELERNMTSERVTSIMVNRAQNGLWNGGKIPFGYTYSKETGQFSLNPQEVEVILKMYEQYEKVPSLLSVARYMNENNMLPRSRTPWNPTTVRSILVSPFYTGKYVYNKRDEKKSFNVMDYKKESDWVEIPNHHPAIVDEERQERLKAIMSGNDKATKTHMSYERKNVHLFGGMLTCGACGSGYQSTVEQLRKKDPWGPSLYMCSRRRRFHDCQNKGVTDTTLGPFVLNFAANYIRANRSFGRTTDLKTLEKKLTRGECLEGVAIDKASLEAIQKFFLADRFGIVDFEPPESPRIDETPDEHEILDKELKRLERAFQRLRALYLYSDESMTEDEYLAESGSLNESMAKIKARLIELDAKAKAEEQRNPVNDEAFLEQASILTMNEELLSRRFVDYDKLLRTLDRRVVKNFISSAFKNFCILDGKITELTLKNGIVVRFLRKL